MEKRRWWSRRTSPSPLEVLAEDAKAAIIKEANGRGKEIADETQRNVWYLRNWVAKATPGLTQAVRGHLRLAPRQREKIRGGRGDEELGEVVGVEAFMLTAPGLLAETRGGHLRTRSL